MKKKILCYLIFLVFGILSCGYLLGNVGYFWKKLLLFFSILA